MKKVTFNPDSEYDLLPLQAKSGIHIKPSHKGLLHKNLGVPAGQKIPASKLAVKPGDSAAVKKRKVFAQNAKKWHHGQDGLNIPGASYTSDTFDVPTSTDYTPELSPIEDLMKKGLYEPYQGENMNVGKFKIKDNKFNWDAAADMFNTGLLALDTLLPADKPKYPNIKQQNSYNAHPYGTGSQAIAAYGAKLSNMGYKSNSPDKGYSSLTIPSNQITMEGVPHDVYGVDDTGYSQIMKPGKNYQFPGKSVTEFPMRAQNGAVFQTQEQINAANAQAKRFATTTGAVSGNNAYVAKNIGDPVPQYIDNSGKPYNPAAGVSTKSYIPPYVKELQWNNDVNLPYYIDENSGDIQYTNPESFYLPRFKKNQQQQKNELMARMQNGGTIYTNDPKDPRLQAYNDSLFLYNMRKRQKIDINHNDNGIAYDNGPEAFDRLTKLNGVQPTPTKGKDKVYIGRDTYVYPELYKKPVQPIIYGEPPHNRPQLNHQSISIQYNDVSNITPGTIPQMSKVGQQPSKYSFTYPTGGYNNQGTIYSPTKEDLKNFMKNRQLVSSTEGDGYMHAAGYLENGGMIPGLSGKFSVGMSNVMNGAYAKNGAKMNYMEGETYQLEDDEIQNLLDQGYVLKYE